VFDTGGAFSSPGAHEISRVGPAQILALTDMEVFSDIGARAAADSTQALALSRLGCCDWLIECLN